MPYNIVESFFGHGSNFFFNDRKKLVNSVVMSEKVDQRLVLRRVLILLRDKQPKSLSEKEQVEKSPTEHPSQLF